MNGGMAGSYVYSEKEDRASYIKDVYTTIIKRDLVDKYGIKEEALLDSLTDYMMDNISNLTSASKISNIFAILVDDWFKYMYLDDLKVCKSYRKQGVGKALLDKALEIANARNYNGLYTIGQDNNLNACMFYLKMGFTIGGFDNHIYRGTAQENKANIIFYLDR